MARTWLRWLPAAAVPVVVAGSLAVASQAGAADLPDKTPEDVLALLAGARVEAFSGTFTVTADLGLPDLPVDMPGHGGGGFGPEATAPDGEAPATGTSLADALTWLTGEHTARVWTDGPDRSRLQLMDSFGEIDAVHDGADVWLHDFEHNAVTHLTLPARGEHDTAKGAGVTVPTPEELAAQAVAAVEPTTELTVEDDVTVAGRDAYALVITPRTAQTLVAQVTIAVDGETGFPLQVTVDARGQDDPALDLAYTSVDLTAPDPAVFDFTPPPGATVTEVPTPDAGPPTAPDGTRPHGPDGIGPDGAVPGVTGAGGVQTVGSGWETVLILPVGQDMAAGPLLDELTEPVDGGHLLTTALVNALVTDDGRVLVGAVPAERLEAVAAT